MNLRSKKESRVYSMISGFDELEPSASTVLLGSQASTDSPRDSEILKFLSGQEASCQWWWKGACRHGFLPSFITFPKLKSTCREVLVAILK